ncbi:hypothetical protein Moror_8336 [Moniliophthora roreri MCA 2997]|uniref:Uncharacterized protein n=2 Tax=Moniliophthora roreri TaxID=221103 RepID=V2XMU0_MONRO|nr:hypothetical protein Moror_8336 [Moniliophthora roreri MCA 2997]KAI3619209.1 hypothetical protein WG66_012724 [Moniliophthora roreri]
MSFSNLSNSHLARVEPKGNTSSSVASDQSQPPPAPRPRGRSFIYDNANHGSELQQEPKSLEVETETTTPSSAMTPTSSALHDVPIAPSSGVQETLASVASVLATPAVVDDTTPSASETTRVPQGPTVDDQDATKRDVMHPAHSTGSTKRKRCADDSNESELEATSATAEVRSAHVTDLARRKRRAYNLVDGPVPPSGNVLPVSKQMPSISTPDAATTRATANMQTVFAVRSSASHTLTGFCSNTECRSGPTETSWGKYGAELCILHLQYESFDNISVTKNKDIAKHIKALEIAGMVQRTTKGRKWSDFHVTPPAFMLPMSYLDEVSTKIDQEEAKKILVWSTALTIPGKDVRVPQGFTIPAHSYALTGAEEWIPVEPARLDMWPMTTRLWRAVSVNGQIQPTDWQFP